MYSETNEHFSVSRRTKEVPRSVPPYALAGDLKEALAHYRFEKQCRDDVGEPMHCLWWALMFYRFGDLENANRKLFETLVRNLYLLPTLVGSPIARQDMWHGSPCEPLLGENYR